jgi:hypothetical protein
MNNSLPTGRKLVLFGPEGFRPANNNRLDYVTQIFKDASIASAISQLIHPLAPLVRPDVSPTSPIGVGHILWTT